MTNFFQIISTKITVMFTAVMVSIASVLPWSGPSRTKTVDAPTASPTVVVLEPSTPSASVTSTPTPNVKTKVKTTPIPIPTSLPTLTTQLQVYSIIPISVMNIGAMEPHLQVIAQKAYQEFLRTANLTLLDEPNQMEILVGIYARMLREEVAATQQNISRLKQEITPTPTPSPTPTPVPIYTNPEVETKLTELSQTLENIQNQPVAMNIIVGRTQRAYQDWIANNSAIYSVILSSRYISDLNSILRAYGL